MGRAVEEYIVGQGSRRVHCVVWDRAVEEYIVGQGSRRVYCVVLGRAVLAQLNKQIEEYREQLSRERKER